MFKLTEEQIAKKNELLSKIKDAARNLKASVKAANDKIDEILVDVQEKQSLHNELVSKFEEFRMEIRQSADTQYANADESLKDSKKYCNNMGSFRRAWSNGIEEVHCTDVEISFYFSENNNYSYPDSTE